MMNKKDFLKQAYDIYDTCNMIVYCIDEITKLININYPNYIDDTQTIQDGFDKNILTHTEQLEELMDIVNKITK